MPSLVVTIVRRIFGSGFVLAPRGMSAPRFGSSGTAPTGGLDQATITFTWMPPDDLGAGTAIAAYESQVRELDAGGNELLSWRAHLSSVALTRTITVQDGTYWECRVRAHNNAAPPQVSPWFTFPVVMAMRATPPPASNGYLRYAGGLMRYAGGRMRYGG